MRFDSHSIETNRIASHDLVESEQQTALLLTGDLQHRNQIVRRHL
jgi:hypothetical protein